MENSNSAAALLQQIKELVNDQQSHDEEKPNDSTSPFHRTVNWTFENMKMLIGSDLPIFGDDQHPAVSLRLRQEDREFHQFHLKIFHLTFSAI